MSSREKILQKLRATDRPFVDVPEISRQRVVPDVDESPSGLIERFIAEAEKVKVNVYPVRNPAEGIEIALELIGDEKQILSWAQDRIPLEGLHEALAHAGIGIAHPADGNIPVGITGANAGLAATGGLILYSGKGQYRTASLLPDKHIVILQGEQIVRDFESWAESVRHDFNKPSNITVITGPSKTADIAQELILGAHGPRSVHIILVWQHS